MPLAEITAEMRALFMAAASSSAGGMPISCRRRHGGARGMRAARDARRARRRRRLARNENEKASICGCARRGIAARWRNIEINPSAPGISLARAAAAASQAACRAAFSTSSRHGSAAVRAAARRHGSPDAPYWKLRDYADNTGGMLRGAMMLSRSACVVK